MSVKRDKKQKLVVAMSDGGAVMPQIATKEQLAQAERRVDDALAKYAERINAIISMGEVAVLVVNVHPSGKDAVRWLGWKLHRAVFALPHRCYAGLAAADVVTRRWLFRGVTGGAGRVLLFMEMGSLLINKTDSGWRLEPGSTDLELERSRN